MVALVIEADDPLDNRIKLGRSSLGTVRILVDVQPEPIYVKRDFKLDRDHWPVVGMRLPVTVDREHPESFEIRWDEVPAMVQRAAANDPTLADPVAARKAAQQALIESGAAGPAGPFRPDAETRDVVVRAQAEANRQPSERPDHWQESLDLAARQPAPPESNARSSWLRPARRPSARKAGSPTAPEGRSSGNATARTTSCSR